MLGKEPQGVKCPAIDGLISEADEVAGEVADKDVLDAAIVGSTPARRNPATFFWYGCVGHCAVLPGWREVAVRRW